MWVKIISMILRWMRVCLVVLNDEYKRMRYLGVNIYIYKGYKWIY
jgi:hypothetical protein